MKDYKVYVLFDCDCCDEPTFAECDTKGKARSLMEQHEEPVLYHMIMGQYVS